MRGKLSFFAELQRRNVHRAALFYAGSAWLLVQVATQVFPFFHIDEWVVRGIVIAALTGFPLAMLLSWFYEWTPQGIRLESEVEPGASITRETGKRLDRWIIAVLSLAVVLLLANTLLRREGPAPAAAAPAPRTAPAKSIAVLPFTDLSQAHDQEYFSDGMAEELLNALAKVKDLKVAGRTSSFSFKGRNEDLRVVGQTLAVANILEGSVRKQGNKVRITVQLIQAADGYHLWSESYDGDLTDIFDLQERIARAITQQLQVILEGGQQRLVPVATANPEAYALYLQATKIFNQRDGAHFPDAISALQEAIRLDPAYARAHSRLAALYVVANNYTTMDTGEALANAQREAQLAIGLDPHLAEPLAAQGLAYESQRQLVAARVTLEQAVALDREDVTANFWLGLSFCLGGYRVQCAAQLDRTLALDPLLPNALDWRGRLYLFAGDREQARAMLQKSLDGGLSTAQRGLALLAHADGRDDDAIAYFTRGSRVFFSGFPDDASRIFAEGLFGAPAARQRALAMVEAYLQTRPKIVSGGAPTVLLMLGEPARALAISQDAPTSNDALYFNALWSPDGAAARKLPQFAEFVRKSGLAEEWDKYGPADDCQRIAAGGYSCR